MPIDLIQPQPMQLSRKGGFQLQAASLALNGLRAKIVARPRPEGNPFKVTPPGDVIQRSQAIWLYEMALNPKIELVDRPDLIKWRARLLAIIPTLRGFNLACWCPLPLPGEPDCCHRTVLLRLANPYFDWGPPPTFGPLPDGIITPTCDPPTGRRMGSLAPPSPPLLGTPPATPSKQGLIEVKRPHRRTRPNGGGR